MAYTFAAEQHKVVSKTFYTLKKNLCSNINQDQLPEWCLIKKNIKFS